MLPILLQTPVPVEAWTDVLMKQAPIVIVLCVGLYFMYKYFVAQITAKDALIASKDTHIKEQNDKLIDLYADAVATQKDLTAEIKALREDNKRMEQVLTQLINKP